jgi:hypothetical protein
MQGPKFYLCLFVAIKRGRGESERRAPAGGVRHLECAGQHGRVQFVKVLFNVDLAIFT